MRREEQRQNLCAIGVLCIFLGFMFQAYFDPIIWPVVGSRIGIGHSYTLALTVSGMCSAVLTPIAAKCLTLFSNKKILILSASAATLLCAAQSMIADFTSLCIIRIALGISLAFLLTTLTMSIGTIFPPQKRGFWIGMQGTIMGVASIIAPPLAGILIDSLWLTSVFFITIPFTAAGTILIAKYMTEEPRKQKTKASFDIKGAFCLCLCLCSFYILTSRGDLIFGAGFSIFLTAICIIAALSFFYSEKQAGDNAVIPLSLFKNRTFAWITLASFFASASATVLYYSFSYYMMHYMHTSAWDTGIAIGLQFVITLFFAPMLGKHLEKKKIYPVSLVIGAVSMILIYLFLLLFLTPQTQLRAVNLLMFFFGFYAMVITVIPPYIAQNYVKEAHRPYTIGSTRLGTTLGYCLTLPIFTAILNACSANTEFGYDMIYAISILLTASAAVCMGMSRKFRENNEVES